MLVVDVLSHLRKRPFPAWTLCKLADVGRSLQTAAAIVEGGNPHRVAAAKWPRRASTIASSMSSSSCSCLLPPPPASAAPLLAAIAAEGEQASPLASASDWKRHTWVKAHVSCASLRPVPHRAMQQQPQVGLQQHLLDPAARRLPHLIAADPAAAPLPAPGPGPKGRSGIMRRR